MLEKILYRNHLNEEIVFGQDGIFVNSNDLHDFSWGYNSRNDRISSFKKGIVKKKLPVIIKCDSQEKGVEIRNKLFEVAEKDVLANKHGTLIIGEYYLKCFVTGSKKSDYLISKEYMKIALEVVTDLPRWVKETTITFGYGSGGAEGKNLDYNNDFPMDYTSNLLGQSLNNTGFIASNFRMIIYGACERPEIVIAGHSYKVDVSVESNEYITIDSSEKTIVLTHTDGQTENCFNYRNRESYIFEKIPSGISKISTSADFKFDVILFEERSEPKWT